jgi:hypothetical protein
MQNQTNEEYWILRLDPIDYNNYSLYESFKGNLFEAGSYCRQYNRESTHAYSMRVYSGPYLDKNFMMDILKTHGETHLNKEYSKYKKRKASCRYD